LCSDASRSTLGNSYTTRSRRLLNSSAKDGACLARMIDTSAWPRSVFLTDEAQPSQSRKRSRPSRSVNHSGQTCAVFRAGIQKTSIARSVSYLYHTGGF